MNRASSFITNLASLALALLLAIFIWTTASEIEDPVRTRFVEVPLEYVGLPANATLADVDPRQTVQIRLEGPDSLLQEVTPDDFLATLDVSSVTSGETTPVNIVVTGRKPGVNISFITPEQIDVQLEQEVTRDIPVRLDLRGSVARGHAQGEPFLEPSTIRVSGPASQIDPLEFALVTAFLNSTAETLVERAQPILYDVTGRVAGATGLVLNANEVIVTVPVEELAGFSEKLVTVEWRGEPAPGYRLLSVTADPPSVLVEGRPAQISRLTSVKTEPIDITGLNQSFQQTAILVLPDGVTVDPEQTINVDIQIEPILTTSTFNRVPILRGVDSRYEAQVNPNQIRVVLFGPLPILDALIEDDIRVTLDLFGLGPGTYSIEPDVDLPDRDIELRSVQPAVVTVTIAEPTPGTGQLEEGIDEDNPVAVATATPVRQAVSVSNLPAFCYLSGTGSQLPEYLPLCP
ncbi:MAG: CdaR family protein, partial [Chloroflexota bacterium]